METWEGDNSHGPKFNMPKLINTAPPSPTLTAAISAARIEIAKMGSPAEDGQPLSPMGRLFHKPESNMYIVSIVGTKTWIDPDHFKLNIIPFHIYPRFNCVQVPDETGELKWAKTDEVNLEQHVFTHFINSEDINALGGADKYTEEYLYELTKTSIDMSKPLWDVHILNLSEPTPQGAMAVVFVRFHHSIGDGMSLMSFFLSLSRKASDPNTPPSLPVLFKKPLKSQSTLKFVWWFMCFVWNTLVDIVDILVTAFFLVDSPNPLKGPDDAGKNPRRIVMRTLSMDDVMLVKAVTKTTINDVVMGAAEAGLTRYLNRRYGELLGNKEERKIQKIGNNLPKNLRVRGAILFNVRVLPGFQPIGSMMEKGSSAKWGNRVGHILYPLSVNKLHDDNPLEYVFKANAVMNRKKASLGSYFSYYFGNFIINTFGIKLASLPTNTSFWFSNMPGPQEEITMFGYPVAFVGCSCHGQPIALFIHAITYADKLNFIISVDEDTIPDPHQLCDDLEQSFELIKNAAVVKRCREKQE